MSNFQKCIKYISTHIIMHTCGAYIEGIPQSLICSVYYFYDYHGNDVMVHFHDQVYVPDLQFQKSHSIFCVYTDNRLFNTDYVEHKSKDGSLTC